MPSKVGFIGVGLHVGHRLLAHKSEPQCSHGAADTSKVRRLRRGAVAGASRARVDSYLYEIVMRARWGRQLAALTQKNFLLTWRQRRSTGYAPCQ